MAENIKHKTKVGLYWTFLNQGATQVLSFIVGVVMARLLSPEDYGITALPAVFIAVAGTFMGAGFSQALVRKPEVTNKDLSTAFYYSIAMGGLMYAILFCMAPFIADFYNTPVLTSLVRITALTFLWGPLITPQSVILQRKLDFKTPARISVTTQIIGAVVGVASAYNGLGLWALIIMSIVSSLLNLIQTWWAVKWVPTEHWNKESFRYLWGYGNKIIGSSLIDTLYNNVAPVLIGKFFSPRDLGVYNRASGYATLPANQITGALNSVTFPVLSKFSEDNEVLKKNYRRMIKMSVFVAFPVYFLLVALAKPLVICLVTEKWSACIILLQILCVERMLWPIHILNRNVLHVKGRSDLILKVEIYKKTVLLFFIISSLPFGLVVFCMCMIPNGIYALYVNSYYTKKLINLSIKNQIKDVLPSFLLSLLMFIIVYSIIYFINNMYLQIVIGGSVGAIIYICGAALLKFEELNDVKYMIKRKE
jgi:O-antigen/teichoic acid export membrane protein